MIAPFEEKLQFRKNQGFERCKENMLMINATKVILDN